MAATKYKDFLKQFVGLSIIYGFENGVCKIYASNHPLFNSLIFQGYTRAEIVKIENDYLILNERNVMVVTISINIVVCNLVPTQ